jgi:hypothetical protein
MTPPSLFTRWSIDAVSAPWGKQERKARASAHVDMEQGGVEKHSSCTCCIHIEEINSFPVYAQDSSAGSALAANVKTHILLFIPKDSSAGSALAANVKTHILELNARRQPNRFPTASWCHGRLHARRLARCLCCCCPLTSSGRSSETAPCCAGPGCAYDGHVELGEMG